MPAWPPCHTFPVGTTTVQKHPGQSPCCVALGSQIQNTSMQCCISIPPSKPETQLPVHMAVQVGQVDERLRLAPAVDGTDGTAVCHGCQLWVRWPNDILQGATCFRTSHT